MTHATWLDDVLREAGLTVKTYPGWEQRGSAFAPSLRAVVWHHDGSPFGDSPGVPAYMIREIDAGQPGAQLWVDRRGGWHIVAAGAVSHAGRVLAGMPGNPDSLGIETDHRPGEAWPDIQLVSLRRGTAAILRKLGRDSYGLHFHKSICDPVGRKTDPDGLDLHAERGRVAVLVTRQTPTPTNGDVMTPAQEAKLDRVLAFLDALTAKRLPDKSDADPGRLSLADLYTKVEGDHQG